MIVRTLLKLLLILLIAVTASFLVFKTMHPPSNLLFENSDFEKGTLKNWQPTGAAFTSQPTLGDNPTKRGWNQPTHIQAQYWLGTFEQHPSAASPEGAAQNDLPVGTLTSAPFMIRKNKIAFLAGAGNGTPETTISLVVNNNTVLTYTPNAITLGNEAMSPVVWDVSHWLKQKATLEIRDQGTGPWGHINADDFHYE